MIWLTWRQQRFETVLALAVMVAGTAALLWTGQQVVANFNQLRIPACLQGIGDRSACADAIRAFTDNVTAEQSLLSWLSYLPVLIGVLLAASITLEMEQGSYRLAWAQSVTRGHWTLVRLAIPILVGVAVSAGFAALGSWWMQPLDRVEGALRPGSYDVQGVVPIAYLLLAFAITVAAGVLTRRTVPAIAGGVTAAIVIHLIVQTWLRPRFMAPISRIWISGPSPVSPQDWVITGPGTTTYLYVDRAGSYFSIDQVNAICTVPTSASSKTAWASCLQSHGLGELVLFHPAARFWAFQGIEAGVLLAIVLVLLGLTAWWLSARTS
jgi:hypothetical protein